MTSPHQLTMDGPRRGLLRLAPPESRKLARVWVAATVALLLAVPVLSAPPVTAAAQPDAAS